MTVKDIFVNKKNKNYWQSETLKPFELVPRERV
jgi:hypothetical protein